MKGNYKTASLLLMLVLGIIGIVTPAFMAREVPEVIKQGVGVTEIKHLSDYFPGLKGTAGDTEVYVLDSGKPGGTVMVLGGTHPNEPSGYLSTILMIENAKLEAGKMIIIPRANNSAFGHSDHMEGTPSYLKIQTAQGDRTFRYGSRATNPIDQWPDPDIYVHHGSGQTLAGSDTRNLNRAYPGKPDGNLTEKVAYGIMQVIKNEKVNMSIDLHEASPEYPVINAIVAHERAMDIAAEATMNLQMDGVDMRIEPSPTKLRGLSHREWGDATDTLAILMETSNPAQGRLRGKISSESILNGRDPLYVQAGRMGRLFVPFEEEGHPVEVRVARHVSSIMELVHVYNQKMPQKIQITNLPTYQELIAAGMGTYL